MTTPTPRASLKALFSVLANVPAANVVWSPEKEPSVFKPPASLATTAASNASPVVVTAAAAGLIFPAGMSVAVSGVLGNAGANGTFQVAAVVDPNNVSLAGSTGSGTYTGGGTIAPTTAFRWGLLRIQARTRTEQGWDDLRRHDNGDGTYSETSVGRRILTLALTYFSYDDTLATMADDVLEDIRTKLWHPYYLDQFNQIGMVVQDVNDIVLLPQSYNGREVSTAQLEVLMGLAVVDTSTDPLPSQWVKEVAGTGTITTESGGTLLDPLDVVANS